MHKTLSMILSGVALAGALAGCESTQTRDDYAVVDGERTSVPEVRMGDRRTIEAIIEEGRDNSQVMDTLHTLTVEMGPRLTGSTRLEQSQDWIRDRFAEWGLADAHHAQWGTIATRFDRGPSSGTVLLMRDGDDPKELREMELTTLSWSRGTDGPTRARPIALPTTMAEYEQNRGDYADAWVLIAPDYGGRAGIRANGYLMRERMNERHELRSGTPDDAPAPVASNGGDASSVDGVEWRGSFAYGESKIPTTVVIDESGGEISGTMSIEGFSEGPIADATLEDGVLEFAWTHDMGTSNIELTIVGDSATGVSVSASGKEYPIELDRADGESISEEERRERERVAALRAVLSENPAGFVSGSRDERVWTTSSNNWRSRTLEEYPKDVEAHLRQSDFDFVKARLAEGLDIMLEFDIDNELTAGPIPVSNTIAEIRGTEKPDEVVIISAHLDSWDGPGSMGATDNGTGSAVMTEAMRILAAVGAEPERTIRVILWTGEEQGLLGAKAYVESLSDEERAKISAAFVDDGGTNTQGGIPAADHMVDYLAAASAPTNGTFHSRIDERRELRDDDPGNDERAGFLDVNIRPTGDRIQTHSGSDHAAFNAVGIPGFFWDEVGRAEYGVTWHTQNDTYDRAIEEYLIQSATNMAIVAYNLANAPDLLPRKAPSGTDADGMADAGR